MSFQTFNPATNQPIQAYSFMTQDEALSIVHASNSAQQSWANMPLAERLPYFTKLGEVLRANKEAYAALMTAEMGKPIKESRGEVEKCAWLCDVIVEKAPEWLKDKEVPVDGKKHLLTFDPLGTLFIIMPWNYPFWQPIKVALSPMAAGNSVVLKHARNVTGSALAVEDAFTQAGFPEDLFRTVVINHDVMPAIMASEYVHAGSLTGSERAGAAFAAEAGKNLKKVVLELGGSDPLIVLDDADVEKAAAGAVKGRFGNAGQVCISSKRIIVLESIAEAFTKAFVEKTNALKIGDPMHDDTDVGPLVNSGAVEEMEAFVQQAVAAGAEVLAGGERVTGEGHYFEPTILGNTNTSMDVFCKEVFGPIAPIVVVKDEAEAIRLANDSEYGLGASVWSENLERAEAVARQIHSGAVFINSIVKSDPRMPFGGIKRSGYGNELSEYGMLEFVNVKTINIYE